MKVRYLLFGLLLILCVGIVSATDVVNNAVGYWSGDTNGTFTDLSGNNATAIINGATFANGTNCKLGGCYAFISASKQNITINSTQLNIGGDYTLNLWIKRTTTLGNDFMYKGDGTNNFQFATSGDTGKPYMYIKAGAATCEFYNVASTKQIGTNVYTMVTAVRRGSVLEAWVDGINTGNKTGCTTGDLTSTGPLILGFTTSNLAYYNGTMDEIGVWGRALNYTEIHDTLYNSNTSFNPYAGGTPAVIVNDVNFSSQTPVNITTTNLVGVNLTVVYNYSITSFNITSPFINTTLYGGIGFIVNGTTASSQHNETWSSNVSNTSYTFVVDDNDVYPGDYNVNEDTMENTTHDVFAINSTAQAVRIGLMNVSNSTAYNIFEVMTNSTGQETLWYCNQSYNTGNFAGNSNCGQWATSNTLIFNHTESGVSKHNVFFLPIVAGRIGTVLVTANSTFIIRGGSGTIVGNVFSVNVSSRGGAFQTTSNTGTAWTQQIGKTVDAHLHQYNGTEYIVYNACGFNTTGGEFCSANQTQILNQSFLPPTAVQFFNPSGNEISFNTILINYSQAIPSGTNTITSYNISLLNLDFSYNRSIIQLNNSAYLNYSWNFSNLGLTSQQYHINVVATDSIGQISNSSSFPTTLNSVPVFNSSLYTTQFPFNNTYTSNTTLTFGFNTTDPFYNYTVFQINTTFLRFCYQESANTTNQVGTDGVCGLNYTGVYSSSYPNTGIGYLYVNYTKPINSLNTSLWQVKNGNRTVPAYNISIPISCWNFDANVLNFRIAVEESTTIDESYPQCYNGSWITIGNNYNNSPVGGFCTFFNTTTPLLTFTDGDWSTYVGKNNQGVNQDWYTCNVRQDNSALVFEEAMWWNVLGNLTINTTTQIYSLNNTADGNYTYYMTIFDNASNSKLFGYNTYIIDTTLPSVTFNANTTPNNMINYTNNTIYISVQINDTNINYTNISIFNSVGTLINSTVGTSNGGLALFETGLADGDYRFYALSKDLVGQPKTTETRNVTINLAFNNSLYSFLFPYSNGAFTSNSTLTYGFTSTDPNYNYTRYHINGSLEINTTNKTITYVLGDGVYNHSLVIFNKAGNNATNSSNITIDTTLPSIFFNANTSANNSFSNYSIYISINASDTNFNQSRIFLYNSSGSLINTTNTTITGQLAINITGLANGSYYFNATTTDLAGNRNFTGTYNVTIITSFNSGAYIIITPYGQNAYTNNRTLTYRFTTTDLFYNYTIYQLLNYTDSSTLNITTVNQTITFTGLNDTKYQYGLNLFDKAGNNLTFYLNVTIDTTNPQINFTNETVNSTTLFNSTNNIYINVSYNDTNFNYTVINLYNRFGGLINTSVTNLSGTFAVNYTNLTNGIYYFNATTYDLAGNKNSTETRNVSILVNFSASLYIVSTEYPNNTEINVNHFSIQFTTIDPFYNYSIYEILNTTDGSSINYTVTDKNFTFVANDSNYNYSVTIFDILNNNKTYGFFNITLNTSAPFVIPTVTITGSAGYPDTSIKCPIGMNFTGEKCEYILANITTAEQVAQTASDIQIMWIIIVIVVAIAIIITVTRRRKKWTPATQKTS